MCYVKTNLHFAVARAAMAGPPTCTHSLFGIQIPEELTVLRTEQRSCEQHESWLDFSNGDYL